MTDDDERQMSKGYNLNGKFGFIAGNVVDNDNNNNTHTYYISTVKSNTNDYIFFDLTF